MCLKGGKECGRERCKEMKDEGMRIQEMKIRGREEEERREG